MAQLQTTTIDDTTFLAASGTQAQRPGSPVTGMMRLNTTVGKLEFYNGSVWRDFENSGPVNDGLVLYLDASVSGGVDGYTWKDLSNTIGDVNIRNRSNDWSFATDTASGQLCCYNTSDRVDGNDPGINIPMNNGFNKNNGTIEIWLKPTGNHTGGHGWFNNSDGSTWTNNSSWFWIGTWSTSDTLYFRQGNPATCCNDVTIGSFRTNWYPLNEWHHWTITWSTSDRRTSIYRDGRLVTRRTNMPTDISTGNPTNTGQLFNGHERGDNMQFKGYCNLYKIYNKELDHEEVLRNFNFTKGRFGF